VAQPGDAPRTVRASEIGEYAYCSRAWWYRHVKRVPPPGDGNSERLARGVEAHRRHGRGVAGASMLGRLGIALAVMGLLALGVALLLVR
jgi:CRISPR/Cas system-associated exonuclease Cas4 (RecB family)